MTTIKKQFKELSFTEKCIMLNDLIEMTECKDYDEYAKLGLAVKYSLMHKVKIKDRGVKK